MRKQQIPAGNYLPPHDAFLRNLVSVLPLVGALHIPTSSPPSPRSSPSSEFEDVDFGHLAIHYDQDHLCLTLWYMSRFCSLTFYQRQVGKAFSYSSPLLILHRHIMAGWSVHSRNSFIRSTSLLPPAAEIASPPQYDQIFRACTSCQSQSFRLRAFFRPAKLPKPSPCIATCCNLSSSCNGGSAWHGHYSPW